jgi:hypothetical protein
MTERIINAVSILSALFLLWICISWVDVISDNTRPDSRHSDLNFFNVLVTIWEDGEQ